MITGDNPLTASHVATELEIAKKPVLILEKQDEKTWMWQPALPSKDSNVVHFCCLIFWFQNFPFSDGSNLNSLSSYDLCIYGEGLEMVLNHPNCIDILKAADVYARARPHQKVHFSLHIFSLMTRRKFLDVSSRLD